MTDFATHFTDFSGDWVQTGPVLLADDGLQTAVLLSLFTDRLAGVDDALPDAGDTVNRRGWWGDAYADIAGDRIGSRLWLLAREKQTAAVLQRAQSYAREALQWLIDDGVAREVTVIADLGRADVLGLHIEIVRSARPVTRYRFEHFWKGL